MLSHCGRSAGIRPIHRARLALDRSCIGMVLAKGPHVVGEHSP
jgi:hypothetical protein